MKFPYFQNLKSSLTIFGFYLISLAVSAQRNAIWVFGDHASWDFNSGAPQVFDSTAIKIIDTTAVYGSSICDTSGLLLFYTDGFKVWNRKHVEIPKYQYRWPWTDYVVSLICPYLDNDSLFYIFGVSKTSYSNRLQAITINAKANHENGAIVYPVYPVDSTNYYEVLMNDASMFVAGTHHCNKEDIWIVGHSGNQLQSFLVSKDGIKKTPVISTFPESILPSVLFENGNLKFSPSGEKLLFPLIKKNSVIIFDFNTATGVFSNPITFKLPEGKHLSDAEFSPDGNIVYFGQYTKYGDLRYHTIANINLNLPTLSETTSSYYILNANFPDKSNWCSRSNCYIMTRTLSLAPDEKIYFSMMEVTGTDPGRDSKAGVIQYPNELGMKSILERSKVNVGRQYKQINYNYIRSFSYTSKENGIQYKKNVCSDQPVSFSLLYHKVEKVEWDFGDPQSGSNNYSNSLNPQHSFPAPGNYTVRAIFTTSCLSDTAYATVLIEETKSVAAPSNLKDTIICTGSEYMADATAPYATKYLWNGGNINPQQRITVDGTYSVQVQNSCSIAEKSFTVKFEKCPCTVFVPTGFTPNMDNLNDIFKPIVSCYAKNYSFKVFDRYGSVVFKTNNYALGWNGKRSSYESPAGNYIWLLEYTNPNDNKVSKMKGTVLLIR